MNRRERRALGIRGKERFVYCPACGGSGRTTMSIDEQPVEILWCGTCLSTGLVKSQRNLARIHGGPREGQCFDAPTGTHSIKVPNYTTPATDGVYILRPGTTNDYDYDHDEPRAPTPSRRHPIR